MSLALTIPSYAQQSGLSCQHARSFHETGLIVCDPFLTYFDAHGGLEIFGYPMSAAFKEDGQWVQYFQRVRMEYDPAKVASRQVALAPLGEWLAPEEHKAPISESERPKSNDHTQQYFSATGHRVQFSFLRFYNEKGGVAVFGYPVTEFFLERGRIVQYFQYAKMEWKPNRGGSDIVLQNLGEQWIDTHDTVRQELELLAMGSDGSVQTPDVTALYATAAVGDAFTGRESKQTVWVYVTDQLNRPVEGAKVELFGLSLLGGFRKDMPFTDALGHTENEISLKNLTPGRMIILQAHVQYQGLTTQAQTFFMAWW
jgi:hypothetical protein